MPIKYSPSPTQEIGIVFGATQLPQGQDPGVRGREPGGAKEFEPLNQDGEHDGADNGVPEVFRMQA